MKLNPFDLCRAHRCAFMKTGFQILAIVVAGLVSQAATAMPIVVNGQLQGATDVGVNGTFYDVDFIDGSFFDVFG